ncbi:Gfo/Idh/MocA family protein [Aquisphaera insulae]|uniref:Gfo/Idh/MocA family protein n=1 Tax=Aquisphaera insulae TaxID=2712864 RepID=UPI00202F0DB6|nr:Gfo/Idh/MocA family oxidoreductase [Aquisphaera insulae]
MIERPAPQSSEPSFDRPAGTSRRGFLKGTAGAGAIAAASPLVAPMVHAAGSDVIKVGLVGCGGRGSGAAEQALTADSGARLVAMADVFTDRLTDALSALKSSDVGAKVDVPKDRQYDGFEGFKHVIDQVDLVLLTTPPHFRPIQLTYAVSKGVNTFVEKPMAVDGPGLRTFIQACKDAKAKNLSLVNGFCWRYDGPRRETMKQVFDGKIGKIKAIETTYNSQGVWDPRKTREQCGSDMEYQLRNWYYYSWLSGDHIVEQAVHGIDTMNWVMQDKLPVRCWGVGGRQVRTDPKYGNIWDHFSVVYEYPEGVRGYHHCRHWVNTPNQVKDYILGTTGTADVFGNAITGENKWRYRAARERASGNGGAHSDMYQVEHDEMFAAIRAGKPTNNGEQAATSTLLAIMGRDAAYTGQVLTPDQVLNSKTDLSPAKYEFGPNPVPPVPVPGVTKFA